MGTHIQVEIAWEHGYAEHMDLLLLFNDDRFGVIRMRRVKEMWSFQMEEKV